MAARQNSSKRTARKVKSSKGKGVFTRTMRSPTTHLVIGVGVIGAAGYLVGQLVEKAVSYA